VNAVALVVAVLSAAVAAVCAASDGSLLAIDPDSDHPPHLRALYERRERTHRALAFARLVAQLVSGVAVAMAFQESLRPPSVRVMLNVTAAVLLVGVSEGLARSAGDTFGPRAALRFYPFIRTVERLLAPVVALGAVIDRTLHTLMPPPPPQEEDLEATAEQFRQVVAAEAEVTRDQERLLRGVFALGNTEVHEVMVPRVDMVAVDRDAPWSEVVDRVRSSEHARLPVYAETIDDIVGILYAKDTVRWVLAEEQPPGGWHTLIRPAVFIPGAKKADEQLRDFQANRSHMAIVVDEFGGTAGLVTIEDVLEEIVGDIRDEYDVEEQAVEREGDTRFWVSGRLTLDELSELVGYDFRRDDVTTVGGLVYEELGRVPRAGERFELAGFRIVVERVVRRRVQRVYFERLAAPQSAEHPVQPAASQSGERLAVRHQTPRPVGRNGAARGGAEGRP
jgi:CBS domain containing-hemolysin-like protein